MQLIFRKRGIYFYQNATKIMQLVAFIVNQPLRFVPTES